MRIKILMFLFLATFTVFGYQKSGVIVKTHVSRGHMLGDDLLQLDGNRIGVEVEDSIRYFDNSEEAMMPKYPLISSYPVDFQYSVQYSFSAGYEKYLSNNFSVIAAFGYQKSKMKAYGATIPGYYEGNMVEVPFVDSEILRHWLVLPIDFKAIYPTKNGGFYFTLGPKISYLISSEYKNLLNGTSFDLAEISSRVNIGVGAKIGGEINIGTIGCIFLQSGYVLGLTNLSPISSTTVKEGEFELFSVGFRFNLP